MNTNPPNAKPQRIFRPRQDPRLTRQAPPRRALPIPNPLNQAVGNMNMRFIVAPGPRFQIPNAGNLPFPPQAANMISARNTINSGFNQGQGPIQAIDQDQWHQPSNIQDTGFRMAANPSTNQANHDAGFRMAVNPSLNQDNLNAGFRLTLNSANPYIAAQDPGRIQYDDDPRANPNILAPRTTEEHYESFIEESPDVAMLQHAIPALRSDDLNELPEPMVPVSIPGARFLRLEQANNSLPTRTTPAEDLHIQEAVHNSLPINTMNQVPIPAPRVSLAVTKDANGSISRPPTDIIIYPKAGLSPRLLSIGPTQHRPRVVSMELTGKRILIKLVRLKLGITNKVTLMRYISISLYMI